MYGLRGNRAREKTALMPDPLRRSSFGCTTLDSRRMDMDMVRPRKDPWGLSPSRRDADSQRIEFEFAEFAANSFAARIRCEFGLKFTVLRIRGEFALRICRRQQNDHACTVFSPDENLTLNCAMQ